MSTNKLNTSDYIAKRFGLKYDPPQIILEYLVPSTGKLYHHKIKLDFMTADSNISEVVNALQKKHSVYFTNNKITSQQLEKLVVKVKRQLPTQPNRQGEKLNLKSDTLVSNENKNYQLAQKPQTSYIASKNVSKQIEQTTITGTTKKPEIENFAIKSQNSTITSITQVSKQATPTLNNEQKDILSNNKYLGNNATKAASTPIQVQPKKVEKEQLNSYDLSLSEYDSTEERITAPIKPIVSNAAQLKQSTTAMTINSQQTKKESPLPAFNNSNNNAKKNNQPEPKKNDFGFDDLSEDDEDEYKPTAPIQKQENQSKGNIKNEEEEEDEVYEEIYDDDFEQSLSNSTPKIDYQNTDLNKLNKEELDKHKAFMEKDFMKNQKKPGDKDFIYDKRETFDQNESNEWDEEY